MHPFVTPLIIVAVCVVASATAAETPNPAVKPVPDGYHTITTHLAVTDGTKAIEFYQKVFGATQLERHDWPDGTIMIAKLKIGDSIIMLSEFPQPPEGLLKAPKEIGRTTAVIHLYVPDADAVFAKAVAAGATVAMPVEDQFWGDRFGMLFDPFGHCWSIATHIKDLTPEQLEEASKKMFAKPTDGGK
jgi:PhnB protein